MKIIKTMLLACLLGSSVGTWAMEYKEEQKSQYDNSPRQQTTEIQKSKDGKNVTVFGRKTFYGFTAEELKAMPLVRALEKYDLDFTRIKRERVLEGTTLNNVLMFHSQDSYKLDIVNNIVSGNENYVEEITFGTKVLGYIVRDNDDDHMMMYSFEIINPLVKSPNDNGNIVFVDFLHMYAPSTIYYSIYADKNKNDQKAQMFRSILYKIMDPTIHLCMPEYSNAKEDPLRESYNAEGKTYEDRHRGIFPPMKLPVEEQIIDNFPLTVFINQGDLDEISGKNRVQDTLRLVKERGFKSEILFPFWFSDNLSICPEECISDILAADFPLMCDKKQPKPLSVTKFHFYEDCWQKDWIQEIFECIPFFFKSCGKENSDLFAIMLEDWGSEDSEGTLSFFRPEIMKKAEERNMVIDFFTEQSGKSRVTITPKKFFFLNSMKAIKSEMRKIYSPEKDNCDKKAPRKEIIWETLRVCGSKTL